MSATGRLFEGPGAVGADQATFRGRVVSVTEEGGHVAVVLDQTLFYPSSGGQPCDLGSLAGVPVVDVIERGETIVHLLDPREEAGPEPGSQVEGRIDLARRRDHTEQHSGQHLLSAAFLRHDVPTLSFHLGAEVSSIDVGAERLTTDLLRAVEDEVNADIRACHAVTATVLRGEDAALAVDGLRKAPERELLDSPRGLRIVQFGADSAPLDRDPCCGTHVANTGQLGSLVVLGTERGRKGETRVTFAVGGRAVSAVRTRLNALQATCEALTAGFEELEARSHKLLDGAKQLRRELKQTRGRLVDLEAEAFARSATGLVLAHVLEEGDAKGAGAFARACLAVRPDALVGVLHKGERLTLVLAGGPQAPALDAGALLRDVLGPFGGRGGGSPSFAQGAASDPTQADALLAAVRAALERSDLRVSHPDEVV